MNFLWYRNVDKKESEEKENSSIVSKPQVKRTEEGAQLLLPAESKLADGSSGANAVNNSGTLLLIVYFYIDVIGMFPIL